MLKHVLCKKCGYKLRRANKKALWDIYKEVLIVII